MKNGAVISDLHLFAARHDNLAALRALEALRDDLSFLVLNGDIIDFRWSHHPTNQDTIAAGLDWLKNLSNTLPDCTIYYIMGNHDCGQDWADALDTLRSDRFLWSPTHFRIGEHLYLHGDLPLEGKNPFERTLPAQNHKIPAPHVMSPLYSAALHLRLHALAPKALGAKTAVPRIYKTILRHAPANMDTIKHIYFGHTHAPFNNYTYKSITFHNTGCSIRHLKINPIRMVAHE